MKHLHDTLAFKAVGFASGISIAFKYRNELALLFCVEDVNCTPKHYSLSRFSGRFEPV